MRRKVIALLLCATFCLAKLSAQEFAVQHIDTTLLKNANAVCRLNECRIAWLSVSKVKVYEKKVITILNDKGSDWAEVVVWQDHFKTIKKLFASTLDSRGITQRKKSLNDATQYSTLDYSTLANDIKVKVLDMRMGVYPYTIVVEEEYIIDGLLALPSWTPQGNSELSVEKGLCEITVAPELALKTKVKNFDTSSLKVVSNTPILKSWSIANIQAKAKEPFTIPWRYSQPQILLAPLHFEIEGYQGATQTWASFGLFISKLMEAAGELPAPVKADIHALTDTIKEAKQKAFAIFRYHQNHTHYVSVQLGIGGWKPLDASYVYAKKYGDCKALSNYLVAMMREAKLPAYYTLVYAGRNESLLDSTFPSNQFNHVIVYVPLPKDTLWFESTDQHITPNYLGSFTCNRKALMVDGDKSKLITTQKISAADNLSKRNLKATINDMGDLLGDLHVVYAGISQENWNDAYYRLSNEQQKQFLIEEMDLPNVSIGSFTLRPVANDKPGIVERVAFSTSGYANKVGTRLFFKANVLNKMSLSLSPNPNRKAPLYIGNGFEDRDTITLDIPPDYVAESIPPNHRLTYDFGRYEVQYKLAGNQLLFIRHFTIHQGTYPASQYNEWVRFLQEIANHDNKKVVLVKN